jgi:hypothetical protein
MPGAVPLVRMDIRAAVPPLPRASLTVLRARCVPRAVRLVARVTARQVHTRAALTYGDRVTALRARLGSIALVAKPLSVEHVWQATIVLRQPHRPVNTRVQRVRILAPLIFTTVLNVCRVLLVRTAWAGCLLRPVVRLALTPRLITLCLLGRVRFVLLGFIARPAAPSSWNVGSDTSRLRVRAHAPPVLWGTIVGATPHLRQQC